MVTHYVYWLGFVGVQHHSVTVTVWPCEVWTWLLFSYITCFLTSQLRHITPFTNYMDWIAATGYNLSFYPTALKGCAGVIFNHGLRMSGHLGGRVRSGKMLVHSVSQKPWGAICWSLGTLFGAWVVSVQSHGVTLIWIWPCCSNLIVWPWFHL